MLYHIIEIRDPQTEELIATGKVVAENFRDGTVELEGGVSYKVDEYLIVNTRVFIR